MQSARLKFCSETNILATILYLIMYLVILQYCSYLFYVVNLISTIAHDVVSLNVDVRQMEDPLRLPGGRLPRRRPRRGRVRPVQVRDTEAPVGHPPALLGAFPFVHLKYSVATCNKLITLLEYM